MKTSKLKFIAIMAAFGFSGLWLSGCKDKNAGSYATNQDSMAVNLTDTSMYNSPVTDTTTQGFTGNPTTTSTYSDTSTHTGRTKGRRVRVMAAAPTVNRNTKMTTDTRGYYNYTETMPSYPGGQASLENDINSRLEYPQEALDNNIEGTVTVRFTIDEKGKVGNVQTSGPALGYGLEEAAMRAVSSTRWVAGTVNGRNVKTWYTLPLTFKIQD